MTKYFLLIVCVLSLAAHAAPIDNMKPLEKFVANTSLNVALCQASMTGYILPKSLSGKDDSAAREKAEMCIDDARAKRSSEFEQLNQQFATIPETVRILKDFYATWLTAMDHIQRGSFLSSNLAYRQYEHRLKELESQLTEKGNRLKLE